ncbi:13809_t:CDS:2, partial [Cetraspora pellucida]
LTHDKLPPCDSVHKQHIYYHSSDINNCDIIQYGIVDEDQQE